MLITEYAATPQHHWLYRLAPFRWLLGRLEPFLPGFWQEDISAGLGNALGQYGKLLDGDPNIELCFAGFYRVMRFDIAAK